MINNVYDQALHIIGTPEKYVKQIGVSFLVFTRLRHMRSSGTVKVFAFKLTEFDEEWTLYNPLLNSIINL